MSLRYFNVYGEKQNIDGAYALVIGMFLNQRFNEKSLTVRGDGSQRRDFTYVGDVVRANILASRSEHVGSGEIINIGNGNNKSINEIASYVGGKIKYIEPVLEPFETLADNLKAKKLLNWEPKQDVKSWIKDYIKKIMSKKILITGGAGFIAHHVIDKILSTTDWEIITLDRLDFSGNLNR